MNNRVLKRFTIIAILFVVFITILFAIPFIRFIKESGQLRNFIESFGLLAPIAYIVLTILQILVPFIPGEPFELMAGYVFGSLKGSLLCFFSEALASILIVLVVKRFGSILVEYFFTKEKIEKLSFLKNKKAFALYALLFMIPGTPKDILCYVGALANYKTIPLILITTILRLPGILTSTISAGAMGDQNYRFGILVYTITVILSILGFLFYNYIEKKKS